MKKVFKVLLVMLVALVPFVAVDAKSKKTTTTAAPAREKINFYVFYGNGCPHCEDLLSYITELDNDKNYNYMYNVVKYETWYNSENAALMQKVFNYFGVMDEKQMGVPLYIIGDEYFTGFPNPDSASEAQLNNAYNGIKNALSKAYNNDNYVDVVAGIGSGKIDVDAKDLNEENNDKSNTVISAVILGVVAIIVVAIIIGRSKSDVYVPVEENDDDEESKSEEVKEEKVEEPKVTAKKTTAKKVPAKTSKTTVKKTTKTTSTKKKTTKK